MYLRLLRTLGLLASVSVLVAGRVHGSERTFPVGSIPSPGSIEWTIALVEARKGANRPPRTAKELVEHYDRLIALNRDCTLCRRSLHERLKYQLENEFNRSGLIDRIDEEFADTPLELSRVLLRTGRPAEARVIARREMNKARFVDE